MTSEQIKTQIDKNNALIEELMSPTMFILNKQVAALMKQNDELRSMCVHEFKDGACIHCYASEKKSN